MRKFKKHRCNEILFCELEPGGYILGEVDDFLDVIVNAGSHNLIIHAEAIDGRFFDLKSGLLGEVLQKMSNYKVTLAVIGDFSGYSSKSLKAFMVECSRDRRVVFAENIESAMKRIRPYPEFR